MAKQAALDAATKRVALGASTKNTATNIAAPQNTTTQGPKSSSPGDISQAFAGTAQFQAPAQFQTYVPSTGQTTTGQAAVDTLKNQGGATQQQIKSAQQQVTQQANPQKSTQPTPANPNAAPNNLNLLNTPPAVTATTPQQEYGFAAPPTQQQQQNLANAGQMSGPSPQQQAVNSTLNKTVAPREAFATEEGYQHYLARQNQQNQGAQEQPQMQSQESQPPAQSTTLQQSPQIQPNVSANQQQTPLQNPVGGPVAPLPPTPQQQIGTALVGQSQNSMQADLDTILNSSPDTSAAALIKQGLMLQLQAINDPAVNDYFDRMDQRATASYDRGLSLVKTSEDEMQKAMDGTLTAPTTSAGLQAKIAQENKENQLSSITEEKDYQQKQHELQLQQLQDSRADLEGYAKAKLFAMGAQDSSAGITLMSKMTHQADMQIQLANLDYNHGQQQLNIQSRKLMSDYTNNISSLVIATDNQRKDTLANYSDQLSKIDEQRFTSSQDKKKQTVEAFGKYSDNMQKLEQTQKQQEMDYMKFAYEKHKDLIDQSFKMSGQMGTVYAPDENGNLVDTGMPTLESTKNTQDFLYKNATFGLDQQKFGLEQQKFGLDINKFGLEQDKFTQTQIVDRGKMVNDYFTQWSNTGFDKKKGAFLEQAMGLSQGSVTRFGSDINAAKNYITGQVYQAQQKLDQYNQTASKVTMSAPVNQLFNIGGNGGQCGTWASTISTAPHVGDTWEEKKTHIDTRDNPQPGFKLLIPAGVKTDGSGWGHVAVVTGYNAQTGDISVVHSNWDLKGTISTHTFNARELTQKYGQNWGYASGQFQPGIQSQLSQLSPQDTQVQTYKSPQSQSNLSQNTPLGTQPNSQGGGFMGTNFSIDDIAGSNGDSLLKTQSDRSAYLKEWTSGTAPKSAAVSNTSFNNALGHLDLARRVFTAMNNNGIKSANQARDWLAQQSGTNPDVSAFLAVRGQVGNEVTAAVKGGVPTSEEVQELNTIFSADQSPQQMLASLKAQAGLIATRVSTNEETYKTNMGVLPPPILTSEAQKAATNLGLNLADISPVLKNKQENPDYKNNIAVAKSQNANANQIVAGLLANPAMSKQVQGMLMQGVSYEDIINYYSQ